MASSTPVDDDILASTTPPELIDGEIVTDAPSDEVAIPDDNAPAEIDEEAWDYGDREWKHDFVDFKGDKLAVRKPSQQALAAFSLASSKFVKPQTQNDVTGMFIARHLSDASYDRVISRMMDPDDTDYTSKSIGELMGIVVRLANPPKTGPDSKPVTAN